MRAVLSHDAVTMRNPSGLKAAERTIPTWPRRTAISLPLAGSQMRAAQWRRTAISLPLVASQMRAVQSLDAVTTRHSSELSAAESDGGLMAAQDCDLLAAGNVPDAGGLVL